MEQKVIYEKQMPKPKRKAPKLYFLITFLIAFSFAFYFSWQLSFGHPACMRWGIDHYGPVDCNDIMDMIPTIPYNEEQYRIHKIKIDANTIFTDENGKPLVYYSVFRGKNEYFDAPGKHPITGETLQPYQP